MFARLSNIVNSTNPDPSLVELTPALEHVSDLKDLTTALEKVTENIEADDFIYGSMIPVSYVRPVTTIINGYPDQWREHYCEANYMAIDPTVKHCQSSTVPLWWSDVPRNKKEIATFFESASDFGLNDGLSVPVQGCGRDWGMLSFSSRKELNERDKKLLLASTSLLAPFVHETTNRLVRENFAQQRDVELIAKLTLREKEVLLWTAEGKTSYEISIILSISERTVIFHHQNLARKLNVKNRTHAVVKAISLGIVSPQF